MAKSRYINTKFWSDNWVRRLDKIDRYLFLYFLTNEHTSISGIYELSLDVMSFETGIAEIDLLQKWIPRLQPKMIYIRGWVVLTNFQKHQSSTSVTVQKGIKSEVEKIPLDIKKTMDDIYASDMLSIAYPEHNIYLNCNYNLNCNLNIKHIVGKPTISNLKEKKKEDLPIIEKSKVYLLTEEITKLENSTRRDLNIIALFFRYKKPDLRTYEQYQVALTRHLKPAKALVLFDNEQLIKAIDIAKKEYPEIYTLETLLKILTK